VATGEGSGFAECCEVRESIGEGGSEAGAQGEWRTFLVEAAKSAGANSSFSETQIAQAD